MKGKPSVFNRSLSFLLAMACCFQLMLPAIAVDLGRTTGERSLGESAQGDTLGSSTLGTSISPLATVQYANTLSELQTAINNALSGTMGNIIYIGDNIAVTSTITVNFTGSVNELYLIGEKGASYTLTSNNCRHFNLSGTTGTIEFENITLSGGTSSSFGLGGIQSSVTNLTLTNVVIQYCGKTAGNNGGGLYSTGSGSIILNNPSIQYCGAGTFSTSLNMNGGGVYVSGGNLTINGGSISNNVLTSNSSTVRAGGGIYFAGSGALTLNDAAVNSNQAQHGGGIYAPGSPTISMNGTASVSSNTASNTSNTGASGHGAGIYAGSGSRITLSDHSQISGNHGYAEGFGGGIYALVHSVVIVQDYAMVSGNTANSNGGGIHLVSPNFTSSGSITVKDHARITDNVGDGNNGGVGFGGGLYAGASSGNSSTYNWTGSAPITISDYAVISGNQVLNASGGAGVALGKYEDLNVGPNVTFEFNVTRKGFYLDTTDSNFVYLDDLHSRQILNSTRSANVNGASQPFTYLYNNYDVFYRDSNNSTGELPTYQVTFQANGTNVTLNVASKRVSLISTYGTLPVPTRPGYTFGGWYNNQIADNGSTAGSTLVTEGTVVNTIASGAHNLWAYWYTPTYTVTFMDSDPPYTVYNSYEQSGLSSGSLVARPADPTKPGYIFDKWTSDNNGDYTWDFANNQITGNTTLYAQWKDKAKITVSFAGNGGTVSGTAEFQVTPDLTYGDSINPFPTVDRSGYSFDGWYDDPVSKSNLVTAATAVTKGSNHVLYAHWSPATYQVTFNLNGGTGTTNPITVTYGSPYGTLPTVTRPGYNFSGWYTDPGNLLVNATTSVTVGQNHALVANWTPVSGIMVTFDANDGVGSTSAIGPTPSFITVTYTQPYGTMANISRGGYDFDGWFTFPTGGTLVQNTDPVNDYNPHTLYAQWTASQLTVTFNANGGTASQPNKLVTFDQPYGTLPTASMSGYNFAGWYTNMGVKVEDTDLVAMQGDHTLYAYWGGATNTVGLNPNGGDPVTPNTLNVAYGGYYGSLPTPTRYGYTFTGWYTSPTGGTEVTLATRVTNSAPHTLHAQWTPKTGIEVSFDINGGTSATPGRMWVTFDSPYGSLPTVARTGHTFASWNTVRNGSGTTVLSTTPVTDAVNHTLYAQWSINSYTMSFDSDGGSAVPNELVVYDTLVTEPTVPIRPGYRFDGWYTDSDYTTAWNFSTDTMPAGPMTLYAKWSPLPPVFTATPNKDLNFNSAYTWLDEVTADDYTGGPSATASISVTGITDDMNGGAISPSTALDTGVAGIYTVSYSVTNPLGVTATASRVIRVGRLGPNGFYPELIAPSATLSHNETYTWMTDVSARDMNINQDITNKVSIANITDLYGNTLSSSTPLDTSVPNNTYFVDYQVTDSNGNVTNETRFIKIGKKDGNTDSSGYDTYVPYIYAPNAYLSLNDTYALLDEVEAWDNEDGNITSGLSIETVRNIKGEVVPSSAFNTAEKNLWTVSYSVTDSDNNTVTESRVIKVGDKDGKQDAEGNDTYLPWILAPDTYLNLGDAYTWLTDIEVFDLDDVPHDLMDKVLVIRVTDIYREVFTGANITELDTNVQNLYDVQYQITDKDGNVITESRVIKVGNKDGNTDSNGNDTYRPWILAENKNVSLNSTYGLYDEVTAWDNDDGELTSSLTITEVRNFRGQVVSQSEYTTSEFGKWYVDYEVVDSAGNVATNSRYIGVGDLGIDGDMIPWIIAPDHDMLLGDNYGLLTDVEAWDVEDGDITNKLEVIRLQGANNQTVDISSYSVWTPNIWTVTYRVIDSIGNERTESRIIRSAESDGKGGHIPWIVAPDKYRQQRESYGIMQEIEAWDLEDGNITSQVKIISILYYGIEIPASDYKSTGAGSWIVTYEITDSDGNTVQATRVIEQSRGENGGGGNNTVQTDPTTYTPSPGGGSGSGGGSGAEDDSSSADHGTAGGEAEDLELDLVPEHGEEDDLHGGDGDGSGDGTTDNSLNPSTGDATPINILVVTAVCSLYILIILTYKAKKSAN